MHGLTVRVSLYVGTCVTVRIHECVCVHVYTHTGEHACLKKALVDLLGPGGGQGSLETTLASLGWVRLAPES